MCLTLAVPAFAARDSEIVKFQAEGIPQLYLPESDSFLLTRFSDYTDYLVDAKTGKTLYSFQANGGTMGTEFPYYDGYALVKGPYNEQVDGYSYTVVDGRGREVLFIPAGKYYQVKGVSDGMITVTREDTQDGYRVEYGFLNLKGEEVIPCQYSFAIDFSEGLAFVRKGAENQLIDKTGKVVAVVPEEASVYAATYEGFHEGMMAYDGNVYNADGSYSSKVGFLDRTGKIAIPPKYDEAEHFVNGYSVVTNFGEHSEFNVGLVDKTGREVIPCQYAGLSLSDDGKLATAAKYIDGQYRYGVLE